jgi:hypothetical protein
MPPFEIDVLDFQAVADNLIREMEYSLRPPPALVQDLRHILAEATRLGVNDHGRFTEYLRALETFARLQFPRRDVWGPEAALTWEANAQADQLVTSRSIWPIVNQEALRVALVRIMRGDPLPPQEDDDDQPRNTLLELTTAALLNRQKIDVNLTVGDEDVIASIKGLPDFSIECKRPASEKGLLRNLAVAKSQIEARYNHGRHHGIVVLGVDRSLGFAGSGFVARDSMQIQAVVHKKLKELRESLLVKINDPTRPQYQLFPKTPLFGLVMVGSVFNQHDGVPVSIQQLSLSCTGPEDDPISRRMLAAVAPLFSR